jgi:hypothetical protein
MHFCDINIHIQTLHDQNVRLMPDARPRVRHYYFAHKSQDHFKLLKVSHHDHQRFVLRI